MAFDGTNFLVVWSDYRNSSTTQIATDIYGSRLNQDGTLLDPSGFAISTASDYQDYSKVAFDGTNYLVIWSDKRNGVNYNIYACRINPDGTVLDPDGIPVSTTSGDKYGVSLAFDNNNYFAVWFDTRNGLDYDIYGCRINQNGEILDPAGIAISTATNDQEWPVVCFDGSNFLVYWGDIRNGLDYDLFGSRVTQDGTVLDPLGIPIMATSNSERLPSVTFGGNNYLVSWVSSVVGFESGGVYSSRVDQAGPNLDPTGILLSTAAQTQTKPRAAFIGSSYLVVWQEERIPNEDDIYGIRLDKNGTVLDPVAFPISANAGLQTDPSVAHDGNNFLVVWSDQRNGTDSDIYGCRVNQNGTVLDPDGIIISNSLHSQSYPLTAFDGNNYLVIWVDCNPVTYNWNILGSFISPDGVVLNPSGFPILPHNERQECPVIAFDGNNYLVLWIEDDSPIIRGSRISPSGTILDPEGITITIQSMFSNMHSLVFDGTNYTVFWGDSDNGGRLLCSRITPSGLVLDPSGIVLGSSSAHIIDWHSVAFDGTNYLALWQREEVYHDFHDIRGVYSNNSGVMMKEFGVSGQYGENRWPFVVRGDGDTILALYSGWTETINGQLTYSMRIRGRFFGSSAIVPEIGYISIVIIIILLSSVLFRYLRYHLK